MSTGYVLRSITPKPELGNKMYFNYNGNYILINKAGYWLTHLIIVVSTISHVWRDHHYIQNVSENS